MYKNTLLKKTLLSIALTSVLFGCDDDTEIVEVEKEVIKIVEVPVQPTAPKIPNVDEIDFNQYKISLLADTQGGSDENGQAHVALHPIAAVVKHQTDNDVDMIIAVGDLTNNGSDIELALISK
ncbi:hypothetical protein [Thalassotalea sp. Y01]|uniref:hypothetical protein n=1 Tax=Thalassotalea sp. Y01 TaxID=2729613 RepID=UPI00145C3A33|nr:hypothetical protein [Thalassotalea sp. Y01]NMP15120.1 hypothetical protein [Thalassotalea sp. Y01]